MKSGNGSVTGTWVRTWGVRVWVSKRMAKVEPEAGGG